MSAVVARPFLPLLGLLAAACGGGGGDLEAPLGLKGVLNLVPAPTNPWSAAKAELGKTLFFDPRLSASGKMSCSSCHLHEKGWTDGKQLSEKDDGSLNTRNSPTVYNVGYLPKLYWDGRASSLEQNVTAAWEKQMSGKPAEAAAKLNEVAGYKQMFQDAFGGPATGENIAMALSAFLRTVQSGNSAYDRWQAGDRSAVTNDVIEGFELFTGKAGCNLCHTPPLFSDTNFHNIGIGWEKEPRDQGAGPILKEEKFNGAFKTPSLRSVAKTAPYLHDGSGATLEDVIKIMSSGGKKNPNIDPLLQDRKLTPEEIGKLVAFLKSLTSEETFTPPKLP